MGCGGRVRCSRRTRVLLGTRIARSGAACLCRRVRPSAEEHILCQTRAWPRWAARSGRASWPPVLGGRALRCVRARAPPHPGAADGSIRAGSPLDELVFAVATPRSSPTDWPRSRLPSPCEVFVTGLAHPVAGSAPRPHAAKARGGTASPGAWWFRAEITVTSTQAARGSRWAVELVPSIKSCSSARVPTGGLGPTTAPWPLSLRTHRWGGGRARHGAERCCVPRCARPRARVAWFWCASGPFGVSCTAGLPR